MKIKLLIVGIVTGITQLAFAQGQAPAPSGGGVAPAVSAAPATTTAPAPPRKVTIPPGFKRLEINARVVLLEAADEPWVTAAMSKIKPTTKPATLPTTILSKLLEKREPIIRQIMADVAMADPVPIANFYDTKIIEPVRVLDSMRPAVFYLVASKDRLADLLKNGWQDEHYYYNRAADSVTFNPSGVLSTDRPNDETVFPGAYNPTDPPEKRQETLTMAVASTEAAVSAAIETRARLVVGAGFADLIDTLVSKPLNLKEDQKWLGVGTSGYLSAKYAGDIIGVSQKELLTSMTFEHPNNPLKMSAIDPLHPRDMSLLRPEAQPYYLDAVRRKSTKAIMYLVEKAGDAGLTRSLVAVRDKKPADGTAMVKLIQEVTGVDLMTELSR